MFSFAGFPRTRLQAEQLWSKYPVNAVINLNVPFDAIVDRLSARYVHLPSGRIYNLDFSPPKETVIEISKIGPICQDGSNFRLIGPRFFRIQIH